MPYINPDTRQLFEAVGRAGHNPNTKTAGELNYELTLKCLKHIRVNGDSYQTYNDIVGALEACKLEFYRRMVSPYEDQKIQQNGDVY